MEVERAEGQMIDAEAAMREASGERDTVRL